MYLLNDQQQRAVDQIEGPILILAGAGTGKTRTLVARTANVLNKGYAAPYEIMAVTFTNKAAQEMKERIVELTDIPINDWVGTFHSIAAKILRRHAEVVGLTSNFTIIDQNDQINLLKNIIGDTASSWKKEIKIIAGIINRWKEKALLPEQASRGYGEMQQMAFKYYPIYQERLRLSNAVDFDDLILHNISIFNRDVDIFHQYQEKIIYINVDEYQDTNSIQYMWIRLLAQKHKNICCVGDDDQSIYGWRGAEISNIMKFSDHFADAKVIKLEQNYRSTSNILAVANAIINKNENRLGKSLWTDDNSDVKVRIKQYNSHKEEAMDIVSNIVQNGVSKNVAILVRLSAQTRVLEEYCTYYGLPYKIIGGMKFYDRQEIKDVLSYLKIAVNPNDDLAFGRIINIPARSIGPATMTKIHEEAMTHKISLAKAALKLSQTSVIKKEKLNTLLIQMNEWHEFAKNASCCEVIEAILEASGYKEMLKKDDKIEAESRLANIKELVDTSREYNDLNTFLEYTALASATDNSSSDGGITIMTLHAAKGLEFENVFLPGWEEDIFPHSRSIKENNVDEERRLAYVGVTRARKNLYISYAGSRWLNNRPIYSSPSRFLLDIRNAAKENIEFHTSYAKPRQIRHYQKY